MIFLFNHNKLQMSSIAQKLCDEICEKPTKSSKPNIGASYKKIIQAPSSSRYDSRPSRSIVVEKKKVINKVVPSGIFSKSKIITKFKSKETLLKKKFVDTGLNTIVTGPLRYDNDCVTMVRKRDPKGPCKCNARGLKCNMSAKEIQTFALKNYSHLDKACTHCIETVNCGTQFFERLKSRSRVRINSRSRVRLCNEVCTQTATVHKYEENSGKSRTDDPTSKSFVDTYMGARRWALSNNYSTRGPDF